MFSKGTSSLLLWGSLAVIAGIFFDSFFSLQLPILLLVPLIGVFLGTLFWDFKNIVVLGFLLLLVFVGMARHSVFENKIPDPMPMQEVSFLGIIAKEPERESRSTKVVVLPKGGTGGKVLVYTDPFAKLQKGDEITIQGQLTTPLVFEDFDYRSFLAKEGIFWVMFRPEILVQKQGTPFFETVRARFRETIALSIPLPQSAVLAALLLGDKKTLPEDVKEKLNRTGTRHITAISGMHVAIVAGILSSLLLNLGLWRKHALLLAFVFLILFLALVGFQIFALRAGVMGGAVLLGGLVGRRNNSLKILVATAAMFLLANPLLLRHDIGFQLSFLAVLSIILFLPLFQHIFQRVPRVFGLQDVLSITVSAQIFTLPVLVGTFGSLSLVSLAANLLLVPLLPLILVLGFLFVFGSLLIPVAGLFFAFPVSLLLSWLVYVVETLSAIPFAAVELSLPVWIFFPSFAVAGFFAWRWQQQHKFRFSDYSIL